MNAAFFRTFQTKRQRFSSACCRYWKSCSAISTEISLARSKKIGRDLLVQAAPELVEVATKRKSAKQALKITVAKTARKQIGGSLQSRIASGRKIVRRKRRQYTRTRSNQKRKISTRRIISRKPRQKRSRLDFLKHRHYSSSNIRYQKKNSATTCTHNVIWKVGG